MTGGAAEQHLLPGTDVVVDGVRLYVMSHGAGPGEPVLLLHGLPTSSYLWHAVARDLGHGRRVVAPDLVGLGRSERPTPRSPYLLDMIAVRLLGLLDALELPRVAVGAHDLGGAVAVHLAAAAPERVSALVLMDTPLHADCWPSPVAAPWLLPGAGRLALELLRRRPTLAAAVLRRLLAPDTADAELGRHLAPLLEPGGARGLVNFLAAVDLAPAEQALRRLADSMPPVLLLWGERDHLLGPAYARRLAAALVRATLVEVAGAGHLLPQQRPERVAEEIAAFLDARAARTAG